MIHCHEKFVVWRWSVAHCRQYCVCVGMVKGERPCLVQFLKIPMIGRWLSSDWVRIHRILHLLFYSQDYYVEHFYSVITVQDNKKSWIDCTNSFIVNMWYLLDLNGFLLNYILNLFAKTVHSPGISLIANYQSKYCLIFVTNLLHWCLISVT